MEGGQERDSSPDEQRHIIDDDDMEASPTDSADLCLPERNEEDTMFVRALKDAIPTKKRPQSVSELAIVQQRKNLFRDLVKGGNQTQTLSVADRYLRDAVRPMTWKKNAVTFPNGKEWASNQKWLAAPDPQGHEDAVRYLTYGCAFRLVDGVDKKFQTYHAAPDTHPTIWVCMCSRKCMACYDISDKNTTPRDEHLKNAHHLEKTMEHGKKAAQSKHQVQLQKQAAQASKNGMAPNRFQQLQAALFVIQTCQSFAVVEKQAFRNLMHQDLKKSKRMRKEKTDRDPDLRSQGSGLRSGGSLKHTGQVGSQVRGSRKRQVRSRSQVRGSLRPKTLPVTY
jgi:hypothetical protein